jgi:hypothetical protein
VIDTSVTEQDAERQIEEYTLAIRQADGKVRELCFFFSPRRIKAVAYLREYQQLHAFLAQNELDCAQQPGIRS